MRCRDFKTALRCCQLLSNEVTRKLKIGLGVNSGSIRSMGGFPIPSVNVHRLDKKLSLHVSIERSVRLGRIMSVFVGNSSEQCSVLTLFDLSG